MGLGRIGKKIRGTSHLPIYLVASQSSPFLFWLLFDLPTTLPHFLWQQTLSPCHPEPVTQKSLPDMLSRSERANLRHTLRVFFFWSIEGREGNSYLLRSVLWGCELCPWPCPHLMEELVWENDIRQEQKEEWESPEGIPETNHPFSFLLICLHEQTNFLFRL